MPLKDPDKRRVYHTQYMREHWYPVNQQKHIAMVRRSRAARIDERRELINGLKAVPCQDCGGTFPPEAMDFDHVDGEKIGNISEMAREAPEEKLKAEISKCEVVCSNCHRIRTMARRRGDAVGSVPGS